MGKQILINLRDLSFRPGSYEIIILPSFRRVHGHSGFIGILTLFSICRPVNYHITTLILQNRRQKQSKKYRKRCLS